MGTHTAAQLHSGAQLTGQPPSPCSQRVTGFALALLLLLGSRGASAEPCGAVDYIGECVGSIVKYCSPEGELVVFDCADEAQGGPGPQATCGLRDCDDPADGCEGYYCVSRQGQLCGNTFWWDWCDVSQGLGCIAGVCAPSQTCQKDSFAQTCSGNTVQYCNTGLYSNVGTVWQANCGQLADWQQDIDGLACVSGSCSVTVPDAGSAPDTRAPDTRAPDTRAPDTRAPDSRAADTLSADLSADDTAGLDAGPAPDTQATGNNDAAAADGGSGEAGADETIAPPAGCGMPKASVSTAALGFSPVGGLLLLRRQRRRR